MQQSPKLIKFSWEVVLAMALLLLSVFLFTILADEIIIEQENAFDLRVFQFLSNYTNDTTIQIARVITGFGGGYFLIPAYLLIIAFKILNKKKPQAIIIAVIAVTSILSGGILKMIFRRPRPLLPLIDGMFGFSFPSGHSLAGFTFSSVLIFLVSRTSLSPIQKWAGYILCFLFGCFIGLSRIFLRVHFPSDVIASLLITVIWLSLAFIIMRKLKVVI